MQAVGGSKGANDQEMSDFVDLAEEIFTQATAEETELLQPFIDAGALPAAKQAIMRLQPDMTAGHVNFKNLYRQDDDTFTPLHFVYEAADCRFFYTADMIFDQQLVWQKVFDVRWGSGTCVPGSTGHPSSV